MLQQMQESMLRQTLHVPVGSDPQNIKLSDKNKWRYAL